jgi:hypothetical protein
MLLCAKLMRSMWNGKGYLLYNEFNFALVFLMS